MNALSNIYTACGLIRRSNSPTELYVSGAVIVDPTFRLWGSSPPDPAPLPPGNNQYSYYISGYSLCTYSCEQPRVAYHFSGTKGSLYIERDDSGLGDLMWFLEGGTGNLTECYGENFLFYNSDMSDYDMYDQIHVLAPFIRLTDLQIPPDNPILQHPMNCDVMLTKIKRMDVLGG